MIGSHFAADVNTNNATAFHHLQDIMNLEGLCWFCEDNNLKVRRSKKYTEQKWLVRAISGGFVDCSCRSRKEDES